MDETTDTLKDKVGQGINKVKEKVSQAVLKKKDGSPSRFQDWLKEKKKGIKKVGQAALLLADALIDILPLGKNLTTFVKRHKMKSFAFVGTMAGVFVDIGAEGFDSSHLSTIFEAVIEYLPVIGELL